MSRKIAFIGAGNMGGAIVQAMCGRTIKPDEAVIFAPSASKAKVLADKTGCAVATDAGDAVLSAEYIMLCVKPQILPEVLKDLTPQLRQDAENGEKKIVASIAASVSIKQIEDILAAQGLELPVIRIMPNTPAMIGKGMLLVASNGIASDAQCDELTGMLSECGIVERVDEHTLDMATALYSCGPAFVYMFIEALTDGGVQVGIQRDRALRYAAQGVLGAAAMVLETGEHPGALKDAVCSPGGITIAGVNELEKHGFRNAAIQAVVACDRRYKEMQEK